MNNDRPDIRLFCVPAGISCQVFEESALAENGFVTSEAEIARLPEVLCQAEEAVAQARAALEAAIAPMKAAGETEETIAEACAVLRQEMEPLLGYAASLKFQISFFASGHWKEVWLRPATGASVRKIEALARVSEGNGGFRLDPGLLPGARCEVMVQKWNNFPVAPGRNAYEHEQMFAPLTEALDLLIRARMYPAVVSEADFFIVSRFRAGGSEMNSRPS